MISILMQNNLSKVLNQIQSSSNRSYRRKEQIKYQYQNKILEMKYKDFCLKENTQVRPQSKLMIKINLEKPQYWVRQDHLKKRLSREDFKLVIYYFFVIPNLNILDPLTIQSSRYHKSNSSSGMSTESPLSCLKQHNTVTKA